MRKHGRIVTRVFGSMTVGGGIVVAVLFAHAPVVLPTAIAVIGLGMLALGWSAVTKTTTAPNTLSEIPHPYNLAHPPPLQSTPPPPPPSSILLVTSDTGVAHALLTESDACAIPCRWVRGASEALAWCQTNTMAATQVIILDVYLEDGDGRDLCLALQTDVRHSSCVMLAMPSTAASDLLQSRSHLLSIGFRGVVDRRAPILPQVLRAYV
jgi:hypothetical protein